MAFRKSAFLIGTILATGFAARVQAQSTPSPFTFAIRYDADSRVVGTIEPDPDGAGPLHYPAVRNTYDLAGRLTKIEKGELSAWQSEAILPVSWPVYNPVDGSGFHVLKQADITYDTSDRKLTESESDGSTKFTLTQTSYDLAGRLDCVTVRMNQTAFSSLPAACTLGTQGSYGPDRITRNTYDAADQLLKVTKAYATSLQQDYATYAYSPNGKQVSVTDANGNLATMTYDGFDREVQWTFPSPTSSGSVNAADFEAYGYDANGNRTSLRRRDGTTIAYAYDPLNRVTEKDVPASVTGAAAYSVFTGYDNRGLELYVRFGSTAGPGVTDAYDNVGHLTSTVSTMGGLSVPLTFAYDADGNRTSIRHADAQGFDTYYDGLDRYNYLYQATGPQIEAIFYNALGQRTVDAGFGVTTSYGYDGAGRLSSLATDIAGTASDRSLTFGFSPASQIVIRASSNDAYASNTALNVSRSYAVNGLNQYTAAGPATFTYDANGNLKTDGSNTYVYDGENRLVSSSGVNTVSLAYDPMGRLWQTSGGSMGTTQYFYDGDKLVEERDGASTLLRRYAHTPGEDTPVLQVEGSVMTSTAFRHFLADERGSIVAVTDWPGNAIAINAYDAWGIPNAGNQGRFGYTGQTWIPELGMWYYKARIYSPTLGRFMQTDPVGYKDQVNLYEYVDDDPINRHDSQGKWSKTVHEKIFDAAVGAKFNKSQMSWIKNVSEHQDWRGPNASNNAAHYLRAPGESVDHAKAAFRAYVRSQIVEGRQARADHNETQAEAAFSRASHAVMDFYSPVHNQNGDPAVYRNDAGDTALTNAWNQGHSPFNFVGREGTGNLSPKVEAKMIEQVKVVYKSIYGDDTSRSTGASGQ